MARSSGTVYPTNFGDTASRGSQTDEHRLIGMFNTEHQPSAGKDTAQEPGNITPTPAKRIYPHPPSRIADSLTIPTKSSSAKRVKRVTPHTNRLVGSLPTQTSATEFDLSGLAFGPLPLPSTDYSVYNDDLITEHYSPSPYSYSGAQRKGISEPFPSVASYEAHVAAALGAPFPLHEPTPLPRDLSLALLFNRDNDIATVREFRNRQLTTLRTLAQESLTTTERMYAFTPAEIRPATGLVNIALLAHLLDFTGMGGTRWILQFIVGFPLTGRLHQSRAFPLDTDSPELFANPELLLPPNASRFRARSIRPCSRHAETLWAEAMSQVHEGWLNPPEVLDSDGNFLGHSGERCINAFRFGVQQSDKLRGCDDLKDSLTNTACTVRSPITLPGWDHIAASSRILAGQHTAWSFGKVDRKSAYKALPIRPLDAKYAAITLWGPTRKVWCGFRTRTQLFGSTAAVLHYNALSRIIASLLCRILAIPTLGYYDDFGFFAHTSDETETMAAIVECLTLFGFTLKTAKSVIGSSNTFLGLTAFFPQPANQMSLAISLPRDKAHRWARMIATILRSGTISHATIESLIGRLSFAQTAVFGRFARAMLKPLYTKLYSKRFLPHISPPLERNLRWWAATLLSLRSRIATRASNRPDWIIYTDAALEPGPEGAQIAAIFFRNPDTSGAPVIDWLLTASPPQAEIDFFRTTSAILVWSWPRLPWLFFTLGHAYRALRLLSTLIIMPLSLPLLTGIPRRQPPQY